MLIIKGGNALSTFHHNKVLDEIKAVLPRCINVSTQFIYFVEIGGKLLSSRLETLNQLLYEGRLPIDKILNSDTDSTCVVTPRIGTISPWSTKATDILHHCGFGEVVRVERGMKWNIHFSPTLNGRQELLNHILPIIHDRMTESVLSDCSKGVALFEHTAPKPLTIIDILGDGELALKKADAEFNFVLSDLERNYLMEQFSYLNRNPTDVELMMFAQVNSEHCRHKIFNANWWVDGRRMPDTLFDMIRATYKREGILVAYNDNGAVIEGFETEYLSVNFNSRVFHYQKELAHLVIKVETHNHPTAISPFAGAATGSGGEIRDEGATGLGGKPKAGIVGYSVSHLRLPNYTRPWEGKENKSMRTASPLEIMLEAPIGSASFNNEFGRPSIAGYFRTFEQIQSGSGGTLRYAYHKPIMLAGGVGNIRPQNVNKNIIPDGTPVVVLGGAGMLIGLGGGAASSASSGSSSSTLDYSSVQRGNPEMQRRCQEVIDSCCALGRENPIISIHDVGAGGLCNALPELVNDSKRGGEFELRDIISDEASMTPLQIWCNESQERYVLAIDPSHMENFKAICERERCLYSQVGRATTSKHLMVRDRLFDNRKSPPPIDLPMDVLFNSPPKMRCEAYVSHKILTPLKLNNLSLRDATILTLSFPSVADKSFLITIADRSVTGLVTRDQMVGPWQVPIADVGVTASGYRTNTGEAISIGERSPIALINPKASGRIAVGEAITNIAASKIRKISDIKLSANWMAAVGESNQNIALYETVRAVSNYCKKLGISIPVGKDSMSMKSSWTDSDDRECKAVSPISLIITAFSPVEDVRATLTPQLKTDIDNDLWLLDLGVGQNRLGGSVLAQVTSQLGSVSPDIVDENLLLNFFDLIQSLNQDKKILAYHDRSDGGLMATLCEMAFTSRCGLNINFKYKITDKLATLFNEELGAVIQTKKSQRDFIQSRIKKLGLSQIAHRIGCAVDRNKLDGNDIIIKSNDETILQMPRVDLHRTWSETSWKMQSLRDNPECANQEYDRINDLSDQGLFSRPTFNHKIVTKNNFKTKLKSPVVHNSRPKIAILREQGVNGQLEMAAAFDCVGFEAVDVTMSDLSSQGSTKSPLAPYRGLVACGGFSFGDVLGAGQGWGKSILHNEKLREIFLDFFHRSDTFALGVCNGCQMMSSIKELIPGATHWPTFTRNKSEQYEARVVMVEICSDKSVLLQGMKGSMLPISTAHGEGRAKFTKEGLSYLKQNKQISMRFVDNYGCPSEYYPSNPNGSPNGATAFTNEDGRFTIMMPHPERVFRTVCNSWHDDDWGEYSPWIQIFRNARAFVNLTQMKYDSSSFGDN